MAIGRRDRALDWLEKGIAVRSGLAFMDAIDPAFGPLVGDPRYEAVLQKIGLKGSN